VDLENKKVDPGTLMTAEDSLRVGMVLDDMRNVSFVDKTMDVNTNTLSIYEIKGYGSEVQTL